MKLSRYFFFLLMTIGLCISYSSSAATKKKQLQGEYAQRYNYFPKVMFETNMGNIIVELNRMRTAITVNNFLTYVINGDYDNTIIHRIEPEFVVQGGGYDVTYEGIERRPAIINESGNGLKNNFGTIAMAREHDPHTATCEFFFNLVDNDSLNPESRWGYTVFGEIVEGEEILEKMGEAKVGYNEKIGFDTVPIEPIVIKKVRLLPEETPEEVSEETPIEATEKESSSSNAE